MKIEEAIKQKNPFRNEWHRTAVNLIFTTNWLVNQQKEVFKDFDITPQQYNVLRILRGQNGRPISTSDIRDRMLDKMSDVSRIVDRLVKKGLVNRHPCSADKRLVDVLITPAGLEMLDSIDHHNTGIDSFLHHLSEAEARQLNDLLDKMRHD
ncbi:MAG: MarR family transcriptional regulator [Bacteroidia bacterium]